MKRRDFLLAPALGVIAAPVLTDPLLLLRRDPPDPEPDVKLTDWKKHRQQLHQDFETYAPGIEYFFLGNGEIQGAIQYMPDRSGDRPMTFAGLTLMDAERFSRKWSTFLFHPERGFERSMVSIAADGTGFGVTPESLVRIGWTYPDGIPSVTIEWKAGPLGIREELSVPSAGRYLIRRIFITNNSPAVVDVKASLGLIPSFTLFDEIGANETARSIEARGFAAMKLYTLEKGAETHGRYDLSFSPGAVAPGSTREVVFIYELQEGKPPLTAKQLEAMRKLTAAFWAKKTSVRTGDGILDHLALASRTGLRAGVGATGKRDSGIWMYNMEWVRDDMMVLVALLQAGFSEQAKVMLERILKQSVGADGRTIESSRWFGYDLTEIDQNGELLFGVWTYLCWTGDTGFVRKHWKKLTLVADFPLQGVFQDARTGMLRNKREYWERGGENFGIEDGFELSYQFWVAFGLEKAAEMAEKMGDRTAAVRWKSAAARIKKGAFEDPATRLVENGMLIKRRTKEGRWQQVAIPSNRSSMPPGSPLATNEKPLLDPDTSSVYPIIHGMIDPKGSIALATLASMEALWNQAWTHGGYSRYNTTSEPDPPAPWPLAAGYLARAFVEAGVDEKAWRALRWLYEIHGGKAGAWFERMGPSITPPAPPVSVIGWAWAEVATLFVHHLAGIRPEIDRLTIRPRLLQGIPGLTANATVHGAALELTVRRGLGGGGHARVNGREIPLAEGELHIPYPAAGSKTLIEFEL